jgi:hypothetical protein
LSGELLLLLLFGCLRDGGDIGGGLFAVEETDQAGAGV